MSAAPLSSVQHQCTRKVHYWSKRAAKDAQKHAEKTYGVKMHRYRCAYCDHWHLAKRKLT
jgi:hypothetical protein